jgi:hypothetical protein
MGQEFMRTGRDVAHAVIAVATIASAAFALAAFGVVGSMRAHRRGRGGLNPWLEHAKCRSPAEVPRLLTGEA